MSSSLTSPRGIAPSSPCPSPRLAHPVSTSPRLASPSPRPAAASPSPLPNKFVVPGRRADDHCAAAPLLAVKRPPPVHVPREADASQSPSKPRPWAHSSPLGNGSPHRLLQKNHSPAERSSPRHGVIPPKWEPGWGASPGGSCTPTRLQFTSSKVGGASEVGAGLAASSSGSRASAAGGTGEDGSIAMVPLAMVEEAPGAAMAGSSIAGGAAVGVDSPRTLNIQAAKVGRLRVWVLDLPNQVDALYKAAAAVDTLGQQVKRQLDKQLQLGGAAKEDVQDMGKLEFLRKKVEETASIAIRLDKLLAEVERG